MSQLQPSIQLQHASVQEDMQNWMDKVVAWGQADSPDTRRDTSLHLRRLSSYLQQLLTHINNLTSTTETMKRLPFLGQLLGRLCWNPHVTADDTSRGLLFQCLWGLYSENPSDAVERKANQWIRRVLCQLSTEEEDDAAAAQTLMKHMGVPPKEYHLKVLRKMVAVLQENIGEGCSSLGNINQRCSCDSILATSEACVPLVSCPEAAPLIGALLQRPATCVRAALSEDFLDALRSSSQVLSLEDQAVVSLWSHSLSSLEEAVLGLLESALSDGGSTPQRMEQQVSQSQLPKACAQHCSIFLVVNDIFRSTLKQSEGNNCVTSLVQTFTSCFLRERALLQPQKCVSLKAFFPQSPQSVLVPLLTLPSEMPQEVWRHHLNWLSSSLQRLTEEEEEEEEGDGCGSTRGHHKVFEAWFLLVQCAHWVQVSVQLLGTNGPEDCGPLLWLLTFYHHPTNRGHHRDLQLVQAREARDHLHALFSAAAHPPPVDHQQLLVALLSPRPQRPPLSPLLSVSLLVNLAVFSQQPLSVSTQILQTVVRQSGLVEEAACVLRSLELRLNAGSCLSSDANRVHLRIEALQNTLTHMQAA